jgi:predicted RNA binding protein YcfA (HicA-like mRNA interferase family)
MVKPMRYRDLVRLLRDAGFESEQGKGDHEKWSAPGLARPVIITQTREISPGLTRKALDAIEVVKGNKQ